MVALKALMQHVDATGDERVVPFMQRYFAYQDAAMDEHPFRKWAIARGQENILAVQWLYDRAPDPALLGLASKILAATIDWGGYLADRIVQGPATRFSHLTHVVNVAMRLKLPALRARLEGSDQRGVVAWISSWAWEAIERFQQDTFGVGEEQLIRARNNSEKPPNPK